MTSGHVTVKENEIADRIDEHQLCAVRQYIQTFFNVRDFLLQIVFISFHGPTSFANRQNNYELGLCITHRIRKSKLTKLNKSQAYSQLGLLNLL